MLFRSAYSALSVHMQLLGECAAICPVPPRCFQPPPRVHSEVIAIDPFPPERLLPPDVAATLEGLLRRAFSARRKMLRNSLSWLGEDTLARVAEEAGIRLQDRPQDLAPPQWVAVATSLNRAHLLGGPAPLTHG